MILQKLASAIRRQDWFQVTIEIFIVIIGIFLGLQVQNWYEDQGAKALEQSYLVRLHVEMADLTARNKVQVESNNYFFKHLATITEVITTDRQDIKLTEDHCNVIPITVSYNSNAYATPTMTELITSGQLSTLTDQNLRTAIANYMIFKERNDDRLANLRADKTDLSKKYPDLAKLSFNNPTSENMFVANTTCDFEAMRQNTAFKNDLTNNYVRGKSFMDGMISVFARQDDIHKRLDEILNITHDAEGL